MIEEKEEVQKAQTEEVDGLTYTIVKIPRTNKVYKVRTLTNNQLEDIARLLFMDAFNDCNELTDIYCKAATPPVMASNNCFETGTYGTATLHVYPAVLDSYCASNYWNQFNNIVGEVQVAPATGDVNGDGQMNISDITKLINMVLTGH